MVANISQHDLLTVLIVLGIFALLLWLVSARPWQ